MRAATGCFRRRSRRTFPDPHPAGHGDRVAGHAPDSGGTTPATEPAPPAQRIPSCRVGEMIECDPGRQGHAPSQVSSRLVRPQPPTRSRLLIHHEAQASELPVMVLRVGAMPAATHQTMAEPCTMRLGRQNTHQSLLERHGSRENNRHSPVAEAHKLHWLSRVRILPELQPAILRSCHRPIGDFTTGAGGATDAGQSMERKHAFPRNLLAWPGTGSASVGLGMNLLRCHGCHNALTQAYAGARGDRAWRLQSQLGRHCRDH